MDKLNSYVRPASYIALAIVIVFSAVTLFYKLGNEPLQTYDEATYAQVTKESIARGNPTSLTFLNSPFLQKPPLLFWLTTASVPVFDSMEFAVRFPSAVAGLLTILIIIATCRLVGVPLPLAVLGGAVLATTSAWMEHARDARFDTLVSFFIMAALYAGVRAALDPRWYLFVGMVLGFAVLTKSVVAVFAGIALLAYVLATFGMKGAVALARNRDVWKGIGMFFLIVLPWHVHQTVLYGSTFWNTYLGTEVLERATQNLFPNTGNPTSLDYLGFLVQFGAPWTILFVLLVLVFPYVYARASQEVRAVLIVSAVGALSVLGIMFLSGTKAYGYLLPFFPFMALYSALSLYVVWSAVVSRADMLREWAAAFVCLVSVLLVTGAFLSWYNALHLNPYFSWELGMAYEEQAVGELLAREQDPIVSTYDLTYLGSILYYSGLPQSKNQHILLLSPGETPEPGTFVLVDAGKTDLEEEFPNDRFSKLYDGTYIGLYRVD
jgi:4-amino-4-deoxy-L-arabinose transferase-like glycosyltransferase